MYNRYEKGTLLYPTLIPKPGKPTIRNENHTPMSLMNTDVEILDKTPADCI